MGSKQATTKKLNLKTKLKHKFCFCFVPQKFDKQAQARLRQKDHQNGRWIRSTRERFAVLHGRQGLWRARQ